jgi:hypothetical protein
MHTFLWHWLSLFSVYSPGKWCIPDIFRKASGTFTSILGIYNDCVVFLECFQFKIFFFGGTGVWTQSLMFARCSTTWTTPPDFQV